MNNLPRRAFISGHRDVTQEEFDEHYAPLLSEAFGNFHSFVVGDYYGADHMAQKYLKEIGCPDYKIVVFHMFKSPRCCESTSSIGGFTTDEDRDRAMTNSSDYDIAWVRKGKENSGTAQNLARREFMHIHEQIGSSKKNLFLALGRKTSPKFSKFFDKLGNGFVAEWEDVSKEYVHSNDGSV